MTCVYTDCSHRWFPIFLAVVPGGNATFGDPTLLGSVVVNWRFLAGMLVRAIPMLELPLAGT